MRSPALILTAHALGVLAATAQTPVVHHEANFDSERKQADELYQASKPLEALPLYEDLCRQDPTIAVFAERHGAGLIAKASTLADPEAKLRAQVEAINEFKRARKLGDDSAYLRAALTAESKTFVGAVLSGIPLTVGYTYGGKAEAQAVYRDAEAAFAKADWAGAESLYEQANAIDPVWYSPALYAGDSYFRLKDASNAGLWFAKAIAIDPDRETAYRYWGDALFKAGDLEGARTKFVDAVVAEPYSNYPNSELAQWCKKTNHQYVKPAITRPEFTTPNGELQVDPELAGSKADGRFAWIAYQRYRVAHGARTLNQVMVAGGSDKNAVITPNGYIHTIAEEHAALRAMLTTVNEALQDGSIAETSLDPSIANIRRLEKAGFLGSWIAINESDAGIRQDYPAYRSHHRKHLAEYINGYMIR